MSYCLENFMILHSTRTQILHGPRSPLNLNQILPLVTGKVKDKGMTKWVRTYALLDPGSNKTVLWP